MLIWTGNNVTTSGSPNVTIVGDPVWPAKIQAQLAAGNLWLRLDRGGSNDGIFLCTGISGGFQTVFVSPDVGFTSASVLGELGEPLRNRFSPLFNYRNREDFINNPLLRSYQKV